jgi:parallel beta-helix repeat protein
VAFAAVSCLVHAGQLEPPGPVGPTMQTAIRAENLPLTITVPGRYVLEEDIDAAGVGGITINSSNVTIDLRGHSLRNGTGDGIHALNGSQSVAVQNGTVSDWAGDGVDLGVAPNSQIVGVRAHGNGGDGIRIGFGGLVSECTARDNTLDGFEAAGFGTLISHCVAINNLAAGINVPNGPSSISYCTAYNNGTVGIGGAGVAVTLSDCAVRDNGDDGISLGAAAVVSRCTAYSNGDAAGEDGIAVGTGGSVTDCTAVSNAEDGIEVVGDSFVARNNTDSNGVVEGAGIHVTGGGNRIEGNNVTDNDRGVDVDGAGNLVIHNSAGGNTIEYSIVAGNTVGPIVTAAGIAASTNPHANYEH